MGIHFLPLQQSYFSLLLKWLESRHIKKWWDADIKWTPQKIEEKYTSYVYQYKEVPIQGQEIRKPLYAFIISLNGQPIGYIQYYNWYDFPPCEEEREQNLPLSCASFDMYIGEEAYVSKGWGSYALSVFLKEYIFSQFDSVFVEPEVANLVAIKAYKKVGFKKLSEKKEGSCIKMILRKEELHLLSSP